jgi:hypothetical protein
MNAIQNHLTMLSFLTFSTEIRTSKKYDPISIKKIWLNIYSRRTTNQFTINS